jgi:mycofactocin precursor
MPKDPTSTITQEHSPESSADATSVTADLLLEDVSIDGMCGVY